MTEKIEIKSDLPMPVRSDVPPLPLQDMKVGQHIVVPAVSKNEIGTIRQRINRYQLANEPAKFSMSVISEEEVRIFRIEDKS